MREELEYLKRLEEWVEAYAEPFIVGCMDMQASYFMRARLQAIETKPKNNGVKP